jgi:FemAB-related protein (PEP-CTERM system-associated)
MTGGLLHAGLRRTEAFTQTGPRLVRSISVHTDAATEACDEYVASNPRASAYHGPAWLGVIERAFGHETEYLTAQASHAIVGVLPLVFFHSRVFGRFTVSMPFLNYGGVLANDREIEQALLSRAIEETQRRGGSHLELRHKQQTFPELSSRRHKVAMTLRLEDTIERQWQQLDRKVRNQVRKAEKSGLAAEEGGLELLDGFYRVFAQNMRDLGTPVYGVRFFHEILTTFPESAQVFVVRLGNRPVAASIVHWHDGTMEVPWASAVRAFNPLCANVFLYWQMLRFAVERGCHTFDFGRSTPNEGTFHFKRQWGAEPSELVWEYWTATGKAMPDLSPANPKFDLAIRAWQRLPLRVATTLGPYIVRNIP